MVLYLTIVLIIQISYWIFYYHHEIFVVKFDTAGLQKVELTVKDKNKKKKNIQYYITTLFFYFLVHDWSSDKVD